MTKVYIDRAKWSRGKQQGNALLVDRLIARGNKAEGFVKEYGPAPKVGTMCCLGFACLALGFKPAHIRAKGMPNELKVVLDGLTYDAGCGHIGDTNFSKEAAKINDDDSISNKEREKKLKALAKENGFHFIFR